MPTSFNPEPSHLHSSYHRWHKLHLRKDIIQRNDAEGLLSGFTSVNKTLDANQHMEKFIEEELSRKRRKLGTQNVSELDSAPIMNSSTNASQSLSLDDELFTVPEHLQISKPEITEGSVTVSASMLTAIPEVNLGPETKLKAIAKTEKFRDKLRALHMSSNSQLRERALAFHNNPYPSMRWRISRKTRESLYDLHVADEILHEHSVPTETHQKNDLLLYTTSSTVLQDPLHITSANASEDSKSEFSNVCSGSIHST
ncbi:hypothetical protein HMI54_002637 [Coelomomyces lativittatus]|nr:hypothetical protein HMI54_002637 [Coelomomyces lativittatus]